MGQTTGRRGYRPAYLRHLRVQRRPGGRWDVIILAKARSDLPAQVQHRWPDEGRDLFVGHLETRAGTGSAAGRHVYGYEGSGAYRTPREAAESLAVNRIDGPSERQRFNSERADRRLRTP